MTLKVGSSYCELISSHCAETMLLEIIIGASLLQIIAADGSGSITTIFPPTCPLPCQPQEGQEGFTGYPGMKGFIGDKGATGPRGQYPPWWHWHNSPGVPGIPGQLGEPGDDGNPGPEGEKGLTGSPGGSGSPGLKGDIGSEGGQGVIGMKGDRGSVGLPGNGGERGDTGMQGQKGNRGSSGDDGKNGTQGERGDFGDPGDMGNPGQRGAEGPNGTKGDMGEPGELPTGGQQSVVGEKGDKGVKGPKGEAGDRGDTGETGDPGEQGSNIRNENIVQFEQQCNQQNEGKIYHDATTKEILFCDGDQWKCVESNLCAGQCVEETTYRELSVGRGLPRRSASDIVLIVDDSGSMRNEQDWIPSAAEALENALVRDGIGNGTLKNKYYVVLFGNMREYPDVPGWSDFRYNRSTVVTVNGSVALNVDQVQAAMDKFTKSGNAEDGYEAIERALSIKELRRGDEVALNLALVTDEPRDPFPDAPAGTSSSLDDIREKLIRRGAALNLLGKFRFTSNVVDNDNDIIAVDYRGVIHRSSTEETINTTGFQSSKNVVSVTANTERSLEESCRQFVEYAPLAMSTGGAVWSLGKIKETETKPLERQAFTDALARIKVEEVVLQPVCAECKVTCVGPERNETCNRAIDQIYCRCRETGKSHELCQTSQREFDDLQTSQYDFSPLYRTCAAKGYPTRYTGWCDLEWPFGKHFDGFWCGQQTANSPALRGWRYNYTTPEPVTV